MDVNQTPVLDSLNDLFTPFRELWQWQPHNKQDSERLKFSEIRTRYPSAPHDCIAMWIADMDIAPSRDVLEGIAEQVVQCTGYQSLSIGSAVSNWLNAERMSANDTDDQVLPEHVVDVPSVIGAINAALTTFCKSGDDVMVLSPSYGPLHQAVTLNHRNVNCVSLQNGKVNTELLNADATAFVLCHPNNPDGAVLSKQCQKRLITFCEQHDIVLITDEVHAELGFDDENNPTTIPLFGALSGQSLSPCLVHIDSVNKAFNLASIPGASYAIIADEEKRKALSHQLSLRHLQANTASKQALICAYQYGLPWLKRTKNAIAFNRKLITRFYAHHQISLNATMGNAGFFLWVNLNEPAICEGEWAKHFNPAKHVDQCIARGVIGNDGEQFDASGFIRLNLACHPLYIERALNRLYFSV